MITQDDIDGWGHICQPPVKNFIDPTRQISYKVVSDGGPSSYYDFPSSTTLNDLIEYAGMSFAQGNIFKAAFRLGNKEGISLEYDLKKIKYYADRLLKGLE